MDTTSRAVGIGLRLGLVAAHVATIGCSQSIIEPDYRPVSTVPPGTRWIGPITLIGDDQKFHIGNKAFLYRSGFTDVHVSNSAVRVPQQDLFGDSLLALAASERGMSAHLGDAMDLSCVDEWEAFSQIMNNSGSTWFWTPGNHDGYFFGNFVGPRGEWEDACHPSRPITKDRAIQAYVTEHLAAYAGAALDPARGNWTCPPGATCKGLLRAAWSVQSGALYQRSFLIQEIELPHTPGAPTGSLILVDTNTYVEPPSIGAPAGDKGMLGLEQLRLLRDWTAAASQQGRTVVVAGHHPHKDLDPGSQDVITALVDRKQIATYISAHTHWGQYFTHRGKADYSWLEPNLGSIIDYDSEYATLSLGFNGSTKYVRMARTPTSSFAAGQHAELGIECADDEWLARPDDPDFFTNYMTTTSPRPTTVELIYYSNMLAALDRYWRCVPTLAAAPTGSPFGSCHPNHDPCRPESEVHTAVATTLATHDLDRIRTKVLELLALDQNRIVDPCLRREYRVCQALWGAEYEKRSYITPIKHEDVFELNTAHRTTSGSTP